MAEVNCPNCKENYFTWYIDEEESPLTVWYCRNCEYIAYEDEATERECSDCHAKTESELKDNVKKYWWCSTCDRITLINTD